MFDDLRARYVGLSVGAHLQHRDNSGPSSGPSTRHKRLATNSGGVTIGYGPFQDLTRVPNVMTMHGAPGADVVIVDFSETSEAFDNYMMAKGAFAVECNHGGGHCGTPAVLQASAWQFMQDHPFGTHPSPYAAAGLPASFPKYCKIWTPTTRQPLGEGRGMTMP